MLFVVDIGTSTFKAALIGLDGSCAGFVSLALNTDEAGYETDPAGWLRAFTMTASRLGSLARVEAIVLSGNGPSLVPVTGEPAIRAGELILPTGQARLWLDRRASAEAERVSAIMGDFVDPSFFFPKALALKNREPELYEKTRRFLYSPEYLAYALTGEARTVLPSGGFERWYWTQEALEQAGLDPDKFPPFAAPGDCIGTVSAAVAARFGLEPGTRVFAGGPDFFVAILGAGVTQPGQACDRSGSSEGINVCTAERIIDRRLMSYGHPVRPYWNLSGIISTTGKALSWVKSLVGMGDLSYPAFYRLAASAGAGAGGLVFLPYLAGERAPIWDPKARGVFLGLSLSSGKAELARAVAEGVCFALRDTVETLEECGAAVEDLRVTGGPAESGFLNQIKADVSGRPVLVSGPVYREAARGVPVASQAGHFPAELLGLAVIGAASLGNYGSFAEASRAMTRVEQSFYPDTAQKARYDELFGIYRGLYRSLKPQFEALSKRV
jgi:xylulokinase